MTGSPSAQLATGASNPAAGGQAITRNGLNQPVTVNSVAASSDTRGNLTFDGVRSFTFDSANRLTGAGSSTLAYDPLDRLREMVGTLGARYLYDGDEIAGVVASPTGTTLNARFVRGPWPDELILAYQGTGTGVTNYSLQDHQNSVIAIADGTGAATATLGYDEYGQPRSGNAGRLMYTGQLWLPDWGLYHYKARAYHPGLGRFVQTDSVGYEQGMNLYAYVGLDPMNKTDPSGLLMYSNGSSGCTMNCAGADDQTQFITAMVEGGGGNRGPGPSRYGPPGELSNGGPPMDPEERPRLRTFQPKASSAWWRGLRVLGRGTALIAFAETLFTPTPANSGEMQQLLGREIQPTLDRIAAGQSHPHIRDGSVFANREGILPTQNPGYYREYVHPTPGIAGAGLRRVVTGSGGEIYFSPDHYNTFIQYR